MKETSHTHSLSHTGASPIAVVILNWNGKELLKRFLPSVIAFSPEAHIYVADNASTDGSIAFLKTHYPQVTLIQNSENGGYAKGYNDALRFVTEPLLCLLNSDVEVTEGWLNPILNTFEKFPKCAAIQPKILDAKKPHLFEYAGAAGGFLDRLGYPYCRGRIFNSLEADSGQYNDETEITWASGACLFIRSEVFTKVKGFDEDYFAHQEEIDLCWRIKNSGYCILYQGKSTVYHLGGATLSAMNPKKTFYNFRNSLYSILKNVRWPQVLMICLVRMILDGVAALHFCVQGKISHAIAILKAHLSFYQNARRIWQKRTNDQTFTKYYHTNSVVFDYFIRNVKIFKELGNT